MLQLTEYRKKKRKKNRIKLQCSSNDLWELTWIKAWIWLVCDVLDTFSNFSLFPNNLASSCLFMSKAWFSYPADLPVTIYVVGKTENVWRSALVGPSALLQQIANILKFAQLKMQIDTVTVWQAAWPSGLGYWRCNPEVLGSRPPPCH